MTKTIRILTLLALMVIGAGQAWAKTEPDLGKIVYTQTVNDHGTLSFYADETCQTAISNPGNGLYSSGLTPVEDGSNVIGYKVYIKATPDLEYTLGAADEGGKVTFIKAEVTVETNVAGARTRGTATTVGVGDFIDVTATTTTGVYCMTMPADKNLNLLVSATFVEKPMNTAAISYIDADGESKSKDAETVYILDGTETTLGRSGYDTANNNKPYETWYVCNTAVDTEHPYGLAYDHGLALYGNVHLILADGCKMTVTNSSGNAINSINEIAIHGQSTGNNAGSLIAEGSQYGIYTSSNIAISGGQVTATGTNHSGICSGAGTAISIINSIINATGAKYGIYGSCSEITISGGAVTATGTSDGGIYCGPGKISITDCNVTATGGSYGIYASGIITISGEKVEAIATGTNGNGINTGASKITITDGEVIATGGSNGIKGGAEIIINKGKVTANGTNGSGIESGSASNISITDCEVNAEGGNNGIKGGTDVTINGGKVTATGTSGSGIESGDASNISITNCEVNAEGGSNGIKSGSYGVTINGGKVTATGTNGSGIESVGPSNISITDCEVNAEGGSNGIKGSNGVTISGGQVVANYTGSNGYGIYSGINGITLGWTNATDYICANSYATNYNGPVKTADGQRFVAYTPGATESDPMTATAIVSGSIAKENGSYPIDGKTLKPLDGYTVTLADDISLMDGTTAKTPDFTIGTTPYYIYKASTEQNPVTLTLSYDGTDFVTVGGLPEGTTLDAVENQPLQRSFAMPAQDVALTATAVTGLTASGTYTYTGSPQTPDINLGESAFEATNYSVTGITPKEGSNSELTDGKAVDVGEYSLAVTGLGQYIGPASVDFTIGKADYDGTTTALGYVCYGQVTADAKLTLPDLPDGASYATTGNVGGDSPALIDGAPTVSGTTLTYNTTSQDEGTSATITIGVTGAKNYNDYDVVVTVKANINIIENDNGTVVTKIGDDTYNVSIDEGDGSGGVIVIPGGGNSIDVADLDYSRTLTAPTESNKDAIIGGNVAKLYTTCQPTVPATNAHVKYFTLTSVSGTTLNFEEVTTPAKDTPYLMAVIGNSNIPKQVTGSNVTLKKIVTGTPVDGYTMMGTQTGLTNSDAISAAGIADNATYILQAQSTWGKVTNKAGVYIPPFRAFIVGPAVNTGNAARQLNSSFDDDDATGIDSIRTIDSDGTERWYDLNGRRIDKPTSTQKGVYIQSGRKVVVK